MNIQWGMRCNDVRGKITNSSGELLPLLPKAISFDIIIHENSAYLKIISAFNTP